MNNRNLPEGWMWTTLEDCTEILDSQRVPINAKERETRITGKPETELHPYYGATGQVGWIDDFLFDDELILLGEDGAPFLDFSKDKAYLIKGKSWVNNHAHVLKAQTQITSNQLLCHYLNTFDYHDYVTGTTRLKLNQSLMRKIPVPLPPLPEQHRIVSKIEELFTKLDAGIDALHKVGAQLKRYRQSVLKAAFEGKLTEAWRAEHRDEIEPDLSVANNLPGGWRWVTVDDLSQRIHYGYTESATDDAIGPKFLRITDIQNNSVNWDTVPYCRIDKVKLEQYLLKENDLVFARTGATVGKSFLIQGSIPDAVFASYLIRIVLAKEICAKYVYAFFQSQSYWMQIHQGKLGSGQPNVNAKILSQITLPLPPFSEQQAIVSEVERCLSVADEVEKTVTSELKRAEQLRQSILKQAFSGKLVPQDPNDEPASVLLERIRAEKS